MNLSEMRTLVRRDLHDEDPQGYRWSDDELERHIAHAVRDFSQAIPCQQSATVPTTEGSREIDISTLSDRVVVEAVEYPVGSFPRDYQRFAIWENTLTLLGDQVPDGSDCCVYYGKLHTLDESTSTIPPRFEDVIPIGAAGYALVEWAAFAINQVNLGGTDTPSLFSTEGQRRLSQFRRELKKLGRRGRVRQTRLYTPATSTAGESADPGP